MHAKFEEKKYYFAMLSCTPEVSYAENSAIRKVLINKRITKIRIFGHFRDHGCFNQIMVKHLSPYFEKVMQIHNGTSTTQTPETFENEMALISKI